MGRAGRGGSSGGGSGGGFSGGGRSGGFSGGGRSGRSNTNNGMGGRSGAPFVGWGPRPRPVYYGGYSPGLFRPSAVLILAVVAGMALLLSLLAGSISGGGVPRSTVAREPLPAGAAHEAGYYTDELGWITNKAELTRGLKHFYQKTGVQPYLYITDHVDGNRSPSISELSAFAGRKYDELFDDQAHFLLVFQESGGIYNCGYHIGGAAESVLDDEAIAVLAGYLGRYYSQDMGDEEFFSRTFSDTADRIMTVYHSPWPMVAGIAAVTVLVVVVFVWWNRAKAQKNKEAEQLEDILNTPLESFGDTEAETLAKKYENKPED